MAVHASARVPWGRHSGRNTRSTPCVCACVFGEGGARARQAQHNVGVVVVTHGSYGPTPPSHTRVTHVTSTSHTALGAP
jgi:hypothetical protein